MRYDVILPIAVSDYSVVKDSIPYLRRFLGADNIVIIGNIVIGKSFEKDFKNIEKIKYINEDNLIEGLSFNSLKEKIKLLGCETRVGWYFQQFIKMGYSTVCENEYYLSWDSDLIPLRKISFFDKEMKPYFGLKEEYNKAYFDTIYNLFGINKKIHDSFIAEHMMFNKSIMLEMLNKIESNFNEKWYDAILKHINILDLPGAGFSEFETYGTYVMENYPLMYNTRKLKAIRCGKRIFGECPEDYVLNWLGNCFDTLSFEKWDKQYIYSRPYENKVFRSLVSPYIYVKFCFAHIKLSKVN